ncbi:serine/threonine-protein kinase [Streptomyces sp. H10-C2]|uniref:serine/threonine-protein kinase n=1 Tax=unclassified Streptomyces TaxID=2593676 RepID=UPI0024B9E73E|nr:MULTISPECIES: serine/threonine-protein kinase [unclassified Streptomyces]MDJ0342662.1 serine/threonine-protein kinase [Streptomyces sp. PH10-H1]MDJ0368484.1 serine/threonine-protein kinase [Streptomyces sp. H10-C2]
MEELRSDDPQWIGAYRLLGRLGTGGMGRVFLARSERGRTVAVKLVRAELAAQDEFRARFRQEVQAARRVGGEWTAPVLDADTETEIPWVATGYIAGPTLQRVIAKDHGPLPERSVWALADGLARALKDIHTAGLIHRDLKPSNVLITIDGPRVIDFGIARALETVTGGLTHTGALVGSPGFMSPEQVRGDRVTPACDIFCLGSVLAYATTGKQPFGAASSGVHAQMFRIAQEPPDLDELPGGLRELVADCLVKEADRRPDLDAVLERIAGHSPADGRTWLPSALVAQLGRHAVRLLEAENPYEEGSAEARAAAQTTPASALEHEREHAPAAPASDPVPQTLHHEPTMTSAATPPPGPSPYAPGGYGYPHPGYGPPPGYTALPSAPHRRQGVLIAAAVAVAVVAGAGAAFVALTMGKAKDNSTDARNRDNKTGASAPSDSGTPQTSPSTSATASTAPGDVPSQFVGTWQAGFDSNGANTRTLTIGRDGIVTLIGTGATYHCEFAMHMTSAGPPLKLSASLVTNAVPATACNPGLASTVTELDATHLIRDSQEPGKAPLTYTKVS